MENSTACLARSNTTNMTEGGTTELTGRPPGVLEDIHPLLPSVVYPILIVFGTVGNILIFIVMRRGSLKEVPTCLYMSVLAIADTG